MPNSSSRPMDRTLSDATTPGQSLPGSSGNKVVLHIHQIPKAGASSSDCLVSYPVFYSPNQLGEWKWKNPKEMKVMSIPVVLGSFATVPNTLEKSRGNWRPEKEFRPSRPQHSFIPARIPRKVQETWKGFLQLRL